MFKNTSIHNKMNYLIAISTLAVIGATLFVFAFMTHLESNYQYLYKNSMTSELYTLEIEKNLNYISRTTRDIMLGGTYDKNIEKLNSHINTIEELFSSLEMIMQKDTSITLVREAKSTTMSFLHSSLLMMKNLNSNDITNNKAHIYSKYKNELTPLANTSRSSFKKLLEIKHKELFENSDSLMFLMSFYKNFVFILGLSVGIIVLIIAVIIRKSITTGIGDFTALIRHAAAGDFSRECTHCNGDTELGVLGSQLAKLMQSVKMLINEINTTITDASNGIFDRQIS